LAVCINIYLYVHINESPVYNLTKLECPLGRRASSFHIFGGEEKTAAPTTEIIKG
jgi:hypothetical protein